MDDHRLPMPEPTGRHLGYRWDGGPAVETHDGPWFAAGDPPWGELPPRRTGDSVETVTEGLRAIAVAMVFGGGLLLYLMLFAMAGSRFDLVGSGGRGVGALAGGLAVLVGWLLSWVPPALLTLEIARQAVGWLERRLGRWPGWRQHRLGWGPEGVRVSTYVGHRDYPAEALTAVRWEPVRWAGWASRLPIALGAQVTLRHADGWSLLVARGLDPGRLRALAERLARDLGLPLVEEADEPVERAPEALDRPLVRQRGPRPSLFHVPFSSWRHGPTAAGWEATIAAGVGPHAILTQAFRADNVLLPPFLVYEFVRLGMHLSLHGLPAITHLVVGRTPVEWALWALVFGRFVWQLVVAGLPRRITIAEGAVTVQVYGRPPRRMPLARLEQVRWEGFPTPAVRLVADGREVLIDGLPTEADARALSALLRTAIADARRGR